jgi:hypothetical protein
MIDLTQPCWLWTGFIDKNGYGRAWSPTRKKNVGAHVYVYESLIGPKPEGLEPDHLCLRRNCVQPAHIEWVTKAVNIARSGFGKNNIVKTACPQGHPYDYQDPTRKWRNCRQCKRVAAARSYHRRKLAREKEGSAPVDGLQRTG